MEIKDFDPIGTHGFVHGMEAMGLGSMFKVLYGFRLITEAISRRSVQAVVLRSVWKLWI